LPSFSDYLFYFLFGSKFSGKEDHYILAVSQSPISLDLQGSGRAHGCS
jgi:hypothetical protein